jgi:hypothetical protein
MPKLRVHNFAISLDGYAAGPNQSHDHPLEVGGEKLHEWRFAPSSGRQRPATDRAEADLDAAFMAQGNQGLGATIMGRNMFGPIRGPWGQSAYPGVALSWMLCPWRAWTTSSKAPAACAQRPARGQTACSVPCPTYRRAR